MDVLERQDMKIKKFEVVRLPFEVESNHPILSRLVVLSKIHKLILFGKIQPMLNGKALCKPFYRLYIPEIRYKKETY